MLVASLSVTACKAEPIQASTVRAIDGDTVRVGDQRIRLVGLDAPESGDNARCSYERRLASKATARLAQLIASGNLELRLVACSCTPGTEGTDACNYGRACGVLTAKGRDVAQTLIAEGLARAYVCGPTSCPRRESWCN